MIQVYPEDVGLIRVVSTIDDKPYAAVFLNRQLPCICKSGTTYVALVDHVLPALEGEADAVDYYERRARKVPVGKLASLFFDSACVVEESVVMTETEFKNWCHWQLN